MKCKCIEDNKNHFPIALMCSIFGISRSWYYAWNKQVPSARKLRDQAISPKIASIHKGSGQTYGSPRIHHKLKKDGVVCSRKRVERIMRENNIVSLHHKPKFNPQTTDSTHNMPIAENVIRQNFNTKRTNEKWGSDITYIPTQEGWLYLAIVMDFCSRRIVGWAMSAHPDAALVTDALKMAALRRRIPEHLIHHSDRGSQYASNDYRALLEKLGIQQSMSRKGNCYDNAMVESFFHSLKVERVCHRNYGSHTEAVEDIRDYIENFYNCTRMHSSLDYLSPLEYERSKEAA